MASAAGRIGAVAAVPPSVLLRAPVATSVRATSVLPALGVLAAIAIGLHSLALPLGGDQGVYFYVARDWLHGAIPYRDTFDHKPPGIHLVYLVAIALFGEHPWSIRAVDLVAIVGLGVAAVRLARPRVESVAAFGPVVASLLYFGFFDYWSSAQAEVWYTGLAFAAIAAAREERALASGLFAGASLVFKPPSLGYVIVAAVVLAVRTRRDRAAGPALARFALGAIAPAALAVAYFAAHGALGAMIDIVVRGNAHYARTFPAATTVRGVASHWVDAAEHFSAVGAIVLATAIAGSVRAARTRAPDIVARWSLAAALLAAALFAVTVQLKFFDLHWATFVGPMTFVILAALDELGTCRARLRFVALLVAGYALAPGPRGPLVRQLRAVAPYALGTSPREAWASAFAAPQLFFAQRDVDDVASFLRARSRRGDRLCARGLDAQLYAETGMRYGGRFFWTNFVDPPRAYRRDDFLAEDRRAFLALRPRFVVTLVHQQGRGGVESAETYLPLGYRLVHETKTLQVLELASSR